MPNSLKKAQKVQNAKPKFSRPNALRKGQIWLIWPYARPNGNPEYGFRRHFKRRGTVPSIGRCCIGHVTQVGRAADAEVIDCRLSRAETLLAGYVHWLLVGSTTKLMAIDGRARQVLALTGSAHRNFRLLAVDVVPRDAIAILPLLMSSSPWTESWARFSFCY